MLMFTLMAAGAFGCHSTSQQTADGLSAKNLWTYDVFVDVRLKDKSIQSQLIKANQRIQLSPEAEAIQVRSTGSFDFEGNARAHVEIQKPDGKRVNMTESDRWYSIS